MCSGTVRSANFKNRKTITRNDSEGEEVHATVVEEVLQCSKCLITGQQHGQLPAIIDKSHF